MSDQYLGEIRMFGFDFAPVGWALCDGQLMSISENTALFSLLGTNYGGDGMTTFALPNLQGRVPINFGEGPGLSVYNIGQSGGEETHTLVYAELPEHNHLYGSVNQASTNSPAGNALAAMPRRGVERYVPAPATTLQINDGAQSTTGDGQAHENRQPYLVVNFIIALEGIFPPRS